MFITKRKHNKILKEQAENDAERHKKLTEELKEARDLKAILEKITDKFITSGSGLIMSNIGGGLNYELSIDENVLVYTDDILGGKVIKQEGIKCLIIEKDGSVKTGLTKQKPDKGFTYKLIRKNV
jgi:hypothetical protein